MPGMNRGDNLEEIYAWIDEVPYSKAKRNIPRDFSDGGTSSSNTVKILLYLFIVTTTVLMAEVLKIHYPRFADVHNYIPASNVAAKRENWNTLNRKVFSKIDMKLSKDVINQLATAQPGIIEKVLLDLRRKILIRDSSSVGEESPIKIEYDGKLISNKEKTENSAANVGIVQKDEKTESSEVLSTAVVKTSSSYVSVTKSTKNLIGKACGWLAGWIWPFSAKTTEKDLLSSSPPVFAVPPEHLEKSRVSSEQPVGEIIVENEDVEASGISRLDFLRLRQEVQEKNLAIGMLNRKVSCLESVMKLKDQRIGSLAAQISTPSTETTQNLRPHVIGSSISRLRSQTKNYKSIS